MYLADKITHVNVSYFPFERTLKQPNNPTVIESNQKKKPFLTYEFNQQAHLITLVLCSN